MNMIISIMDHVIIWKPNQCVWLAIVVTGQIRIRTPWKTTGGFGNLMDH